MKLRVRMGFPQPHYTGFLAGCLYFARGLSYALPANPDIVIEPDFDVPYDADKMRLDLSFKTTFEVRVINVVIPMLRLILTKPARRIMWAFITGKMKVK